MAVRQPISAAALQGTTHVVQHEAPVVAAQTFGIGAVLVANTGEVEEGGADPTSIVGVSTHQWPAAVAKVSPDNLLFLPASPTTEFEISIDDSSALGTGAIAAADRFLKYGLTEDGAGVWYLDKNKTGAAARMMVTRFRDPVGEVQGRVIATFLHDVVIANT